MSLTGVQNCKQEELYYLKIIQILEKQYSIHPLFNKDGQLSFKRNNIDQQNAHQYLYCKCVKKLAIRDRNQLNLLLLLYSSELFHTRVNFNQELNEAPFKRLVNQPKYRKAMKKITNLFTNYQMRREINIRQHGIVTRTISLTTFNKCFFQYTSYGLIDYYNGIIFLANLNVNTIGPLLIENNIKLFSTNEKGFYTILNHKKGDEKYFELYDFKHKNTMFNLWRCKDNAKINRLYYRFNGSPKYISIITNKLSVDFVQTNSTFYFKKIIDEY
jgi:hypothetical protein